MKQCFKCCRIKHLDDFYRHAKMADGHLNKCKECTKSDTQKNRKSKIDYYQEYDRRRGETQHRKDRVKNNAWKYNRSPYYNKFRLDHPQKASAHSKIAYAVRSGSVSRPDTCEKCSSYHSNIHAHHDDYSKPLEVIWLCTACHGSEHKMLNALKRSTKRETELGSPL